MAVHVFKHLCWKKIVTQCDTDDITDDSDSGSDSKYDDNDNDYNNNNKNNNSNNSNNNKKNDNNNLIDDHLDMFGNHDDQHDKYNSINNDEKDNNNINEIDFNDPDRINKASQMAQQRYVQRKEDEERDRKERANILESYESKLDEWEFQKGVRRNLRSLLTKLHEILGDDNNLQWKPLTLSDVVDAAKTKKHYQKAIKVVHPDKSKNRGDTIEKQVICKRAFEALNAAFKEFEQNGK